MRITFVCGHYLPNLGYLEVHLARALAAAGHEVVVVTSHAVPAYVKNKVSGYPFPAISVDEGVEVRRLKPLFARGQFAISRGLMPAVKETSPQFVLVMGLGKVFPYAVLGNTPWKTAVLLGDNSHSYAHLSGWRKWWRDIVKKPIYLRAVQNAHRLLHYTPETKDLLEDWLGAPSRQHLENKSVEISLGFNHRVFSFQPSLREQKRAELGLKEDDVLYISVGRMAENKSYDAWLDAMESLMDENLRVHLMLVGVGEDVHSQALRKRVDSGKFTSRCFLLPFALHSELLAYYNAADVGFWPITAISVFEGMGTGLFLVLPNDKSLKHIGRTGGLCSLVSENHLDVLRAAANEVGDDKRSLRAQKAVENFSYQSIAERVVQSMQSP